MGLPACLPICLPTYLPPWTMPSKKQKTLAQCRFPPLTQSPNAYADSLSGNARPLRVKSTLSQFVHRLQNNNKSIYITNLHHARCCQSLNLDQSVCDDLSLGDFSCNLLSPIGTKLLPSVLVLGVRRGRDGCDHHFRSGPLWL